MTLFLAVLRQIGCKHGLQLKNTLKLHFVEQIFRNVQRKKAYRKLRRPGVTCIHNVKLAVKSDVINVVMTCKQAWRN